MDIGLPEESTLHDSPLQVVRDVLKTGTPRPVYLQGVNDCSTSPLFTRRETWIAGGERDNDATGGLTSRLFAS